MYELSQFFLSVRPDNLSLHSFPTRRSSDLMRMKRSAYPAGSVTISHTPLSATFSNSGFTNISNKFRTGSLRSTTRFTTPRSEEHTSELQSRFDLVCRLLLEKKKNE